MDGIQIQYVDTYIHTVALTDDKDDTYIDRDGI
jgi:hypothetical protein